MTISILTSNDRSHWLAKHSALSYANQWFMTDRGLMEGLKPPGSRTFDAQVLGKLAAKYMVARSFKKEEQPDGLDRRWVLAAAHLKTSLGSPARIDKIVHALAEKLGTVGPVDGRTSLVSAASKFLWFAGRYEARILDKRAVNALSKLTGKRVSASDYRGFAEAWQGQFEISRPEIVDAVAKLPYQMEWTRIEPARHGLAMAVFKQGWFIDRVFDKYLWTIGESSKRPDASRL